MKTHFLSFILSSLLLLTACNKSTSNEQTPPNKKEESATTSEKEQPSSKETFLTGTFVQLLVKMIGQLPNGKCFFLNLKN